MTTAPGNPVTPFLSQQGFVVLDGGLATQLEVHGCDLADKLWSAKLLFENPTVIRQVHWEFLQAGADCITSASYQATVQGFTQRGFTEAESADLLRLSVRLAREVRDEFWADPSHRRHRLPPIVAASIGPYGAYLADGSEYTGRYDIGESELYGFHRSRWEIISSARPDLLACETVPSLEEVGALARLLSESGSAAAWISLCCRDGRHLGDGNRIGEAVARVADVEQVVALGVNCVSPSLVPILLRELTLHWVKPIVVYPNSGEAWDAAGRKWVGSAQRADVGNVTRCWYDAGARLIGGCCRTGPDDIRRIREVLFTIRSSAQVPPVGKQASR
jgi:homocysteine S-methyltransferase